MEEPSNFNKLPSLVSKYIEMLVWNGREKVKLISELTNAETVFHEMEEKSMWDNCPACHETGRQVDFIHFGTKVICSQQVFVLHKDPRSSSDKHPKEGVL